MKSSIYAAISKGVASKIFIKSSFALAAYVYVGNETERFDPQCNDVASYLNSNRISSGNKDSSIVDANIISFRNEIEQITGKSMLAIIVESIKVSLLIS